MAHLNRTCDHEENRLKVCAPCGRKINLGKQNINVFQITPALEDLIKTYSNEKYEKNNEKYPLSICGTCRLALLSCDKMEKEKSTEENVEVKSMQLKWTMPNYIDLELLRKTRAHKQCDCYICLTARCKSKYKVVRGKGNILKVLWFLFKLFIQLFFFFKDLCDIFFSGE